MFVEFSVVADPILLKILESGDKALHVLHVFCSLEVGED
jgi:hypothetical protein